MYLCVIEVFGGVWCCQLVVEFSFGTRTSDLHISRLLRIFSAFEIWKKCGPNTEIRKCRKNTENVWKNYGDNTEYESKQFFIWNFKIYQGLRQYFIWKNAEISFVDLENFIEI